jgi:hypothetical protein
MEQSLKHWQLTVIVTVLLTCAAEIALAQTGTPSQPPKTQEQQLQELMDGMMKNIIGEPGKQTPDNSAQLQELMKALAKSDGSAKTEQSKMETCLLPTVLPNLTAATGKVGSTEDEAKLREIESHFADLPSLMSLMLKKDWPVVIDTARKVLDLEKTVKVWTLPAPRELYRGEFWSSLGNAYFGLPRGDRAENIENAIEAEKSAIAAYRQGHAVSMLRPFSVISAALMARGSAAKRRKTQNLRSPLSTRL